MASEIKAKTKASIFTLNSLQVNNSFVQNTEIQNDIDVLDILQHIFLILMKHGSFTKQFTGVEVEPVSSICQK